MTTAIALVATSGPFPDVPGDARVVAHDPSLLAGLAHGDATDEAPAYTHLVEFTWTSADDPVIAALRDAEGVDHARSTVVAGDEFVVVPGDETIVLAMGLTRRDDLTRDAFVEHWSTTHADLGRAVPGSEGYRQLHRDDARTATAREALGFGGPEFDGIARACYSSIERFEAILADPSISGPLLEDEKRFIDHSRAAMVIGTVD
ncbi:EthD domain-containing protein [Jatrophihabitans fulvus]